MIEPGWRQLILPEHETGGWGVWRPGKGAELVDEARVAELVGSWAPQKPLLIATPDAVRFMTPVSAEGYRRSAVRSVARNLRLSTAIPAVVGTAFLLVALFYGELRLAIFGACLVLLAAAFAYDLRGSTRDGDWLQERALFFIWLYTDRQARCGFYFWLGLTGVIGLSQLLAMELLGGIDAVFSAYGAMYPDVRAGDWWRLLSGPYLHYSITHFIVNAFLLLIAGVIVFALRGWHSVAVFFLANSISVYSQMNWGGELFDNCAGISGGVYGLLGYLLVAGWQDKKLFPRGLCAQLAVLTLVAGLSTEALSDTVASTAHLAGFLTGAVMAVCLGRVWFRAQSRNGGTT